MNLPDAPVTDAGDAVDHGAFRAVPLAPLVGARIEGPRLAELDAAGAAALRRALARHGVLFAPGQHLDFDEHKRVAGWFGEALEHHPFGRTLADRGHPEVLVIQKSEEMQTSR